MGKLRGPSQRRVRYLPEVPIGVTLRGREETAANSKRVKIPNVCDAMGVRCINDFEMIAELGVRFSCTIPRG